MEGRGPEYGPECLKELLPQNGVTRIKRWEAQNEHQRQIFLGVGLSGSRKLCPLHVTLFSVREHVVSWHLLIHIFIFRSLYREKPCPRVSVVVLDPFL